MDRAKVMLIAGLIAIGIWLCLCVVMEGKRRKQVILAGVVIDLVLFLICRNGSMLLMGFLGGLVCGVCPGLGYKWQTAVKEMNGIKNWTVVSIIAFIMACMLLSVAYPDLKVVLF